MTPEQFRALCKLMVGEGHMTPHAERFLALAYEEATVEPHSNQLGESA